MKSIANQYRDLKEGRMSQFNFMRNLRMSMPQYITNTTSFKDAVRILKNKAILTESGQGGPSINKMSREEMINFLGTTASIVKDLTDDELRDIVKDKNADLADLGEAVRFQSPGGVDYPGRERQPDYDMGDFGDAVDDELEYYEREHPGLVAFVDNLANNSETTHMFDDVIDKYFDQDDPAGAADEFITLFKRQTTDDGELDDMISRGEDEISPDMYKFQDFPGGISEGKKKKTKKEEKPYNPNAIHPSELRMGIRVEMEHTDDPKKAEKIALDHLAENPFYYTALKLSGIESPSAPKAKPVAPKKIKKKDATEMVDQANQMQKVKLMKEALEKLIRAELKKY